MQLLSHPASDQFLSDVIDRYLTLFPGRMRKPHLVRFLKFLEGGLLPIRPTLEHVTPTSVGFFLKQCENSADKPATVAARYYALSHFFAQLVPTKLAYNPCKFTKPPVVPSGRNKSLTIEQVQVIREQLRYNTFYEVRTATVFEVLLATGLRLQELLSLQVRQVERENEAVWFRNVRCKGRRFRDVYLQSQTVPLLSYYLERRATVLKTKFKGTLSLLSIEELRQLPLIVSLTRSPTVELVKSFQYSSECARRAIKQLAEKVGITLTPHMLRHTAAVQFLSKSKDIRLTAQYLGHTSLQHTMRYTERGSNEVVLVLENNKGKNDEARYCKDRTS